MSGATNAFEAGLKEGQMALMAGATPGDVEAWANHLPVPEPVADDDDAYWEAMDRRLGRFEAAQKARS